MKPYRNITTLVIVFTLIAGLGAAFGSPTASAQRSLSEFIPATLKSQISADAVNFERLSTEAVSKVTLFNNKVEDLRRRGSATPQEKAAVRAEAGALKSLLGNLRSSLSSIIDKLRGANKLTGDLDTLVANAI